tara:strand:- start:97 stop:387 length:291 start_codon:yes stop_codon:yes gene_type:complete
MKNILLILITLIPSVGIAQPKFWFSNKVEIGYDKAFMSEKVTFKEGALTKSAFSSGLKFKISDNVGYKIFYQLQNSEKDAWANNHFLGTKISFKLQ